MSEIDPLIRIEQVVAKLNISKPSIYRRMKDQTLPKQIKIGRCVMWSILELDFAIKHGRIMSKEEKEKEIERREKIYFENIEK